jgi:hypothetical protein
LSVTSATRHVVGPGRQVAAQQAAPAELPTPGIKILTNLIVKQAGNSETGITIPAVVAGSALAFVEQAYGAPQIVIGKNRSCIVRVF